MPKIGSWLCAIARAELDVTGYLADWANDADIEARENLQRFLGDHRAELNGDVSPGAYWEDAGAQWEQVKQWACGVEARRSR